jgi:uncharacterized membrane protein YqjE
MSRIAMLLTGTALLVCAVLIAAAMWDLQLGPEFWPTVPVLGVLGAAGVLGALTPRIGV